MFCTCSPTLMVPLYCYYPDDPSPSHPCNYPDEYSSCALIVPSRPSQPSSDTFPLPKGSRVQVCIIADVCDKLLRTWNEDVWLDHTICSISELNTYLIILNPKLSMDLRTSLA